MGGWYAIDAIEPALDETKAFLWPPETGLWLRLAVVVFFVGGPGGSFGGGLQNAGQGFGRSVEGGGGGGGAELEQAIEEMVSQPGFVRTVLLAAAVVLAVLLIFTYLSAVFEFVFYRSLLDERVRLRELFRRYAVDGLKYWAFNVAVLLALFGSMGVFLVAVVVEPVTAVALVLPLLAVWLGLAIVGFFVRTLAIPTMVREETGFVEALRLTYRRVRREWKQAAVFLFTNLVVTVAAGLVAGLGIMLALIVLGIPLGVVAVVAWMLHPALVLIPVVIGVVGLLTAYFAVAIPVQTYVFRWVLDVHEGFADGA